MYNIKITKKSEGTFSFVNLEMIEASMSRFKIDIYYPEHDIPIHTKHFISYVTSYIRDIAKFAMNTHNSIDHEYTITTELELGPTDYIESDSVFNHIRSFLKQSLGAYNEASVYVSALDINDDEAFYKLINDLVLTKYITYDATDLPQLMFD